MVIKIFFDPSKKAQAMEIQSRLAGLGFRAPLLELPASVIKGNTLTYHSQSDAKAQEIVAVLKPIVKDLQARKAPEKIGFAKLGDLKDGKWVLDIPYWNPDPKSLQLAIGAV